MYTLKIYPVDSLKGPVCKIINKLICRDPFLVSIFIFCMRSPSKDVIVFLCSVFTGPWIGQSNLNKTTVLVIVNVISYNLSREINKQTSTPNTNVPWYWCHQIFHSKTHLVNFLLHNWALFCYLDCTLSKMYLYFWKKYIILIWCYLVQCGSLAHQEKQ